LLNDGVMYIPASTASTRIDARTGSIIWKNSVSPLRHTTARRRGYGDKVYVATSDSHLVALDARTGGVRWDEVGGGYAITGGAPLVADARSSSAGNRPNGFIQAFDAVQGNTPGPGRTAEARGSRVRDVGARNPGRPPIWVSGSSIRNEPYLPGHRHRTRWTGLARRRQLYQHPLSRTRILGLRHADQVQAYFPVTASNA